MFDDILKAAKSGGNGFGSSKVPNYPDGFAEGSLSWPSISRTIVESLADGWFEAYGPVPVIDSVPKKAARDPKNYFSLFASFLFEDKQLNVIPSFSRNFDDFGQIQKIDSSPLGKSLLAALEKLGVMWFYETRYAVDEKISVERLDAHDEGIAQWTSYFGMPIQQRFRVYKDSAGVETIVWFSQVLAATREFEHIRTRLFSLDDQEYAAEIEEKDVADGVLTFGQWSTNFFIPSLAKKLFYLGETNFPSSLFAFPRTSAYSGLDEASLPTPFLVNERRASTGGAFDQNRETLLHSSTILPNVISMGWSFTASDSESLEVIISRISDALVRINSYLEDGYLNYNGADQPYRFDNVVLSASSFDTDSDRLGSSVGLSRWIPVVRVGLLLNETNVRGEKAEQASKDRTDEVVRAEFSWIANDGAGAYVPSCINTFVYSWLLPERRWEEIDRLLDAVVRLEMKNEATNALSNWAISFYLRGDEDKAIELFEKALDRKDGFAEDEASYFLALIWEARGDSQKAASYRTRCEAAGGYVPPAFMPLEPSKTVPVDPGTQPMVSTGKKLAKFCINCGSKFDLAESRFCGECGTERAL
jgi:hypothetical protein